MDQANPCNWTSTSGASRDDQSKKLMLIPMKMGRSGRIGCGASGTLNLFLWAFWRKIQPRRSWRVFSSFLEQIDMHCHVRQWNSEQYFLPLMKRCGFAALSVAIPVNLKSSSCAFSEKTQPRRSSSVWQCFYEQIKTVLPLTGIEK